MLLSMGSSGESTGPGTRGTTSTHRIILCACVCWPKFWFVLVLCSLRGFGSFCSFLHFSHPSLQEHPLYKYPPQWYTLVVRLCRRSIKEPSPRTPTPPTPDYQSFHWKICLQKASEISRFIVLLFAQPALPPERVSSRHNSYSLSYLSLFFYLHKMRGRIIRK